MAASVICFKPSRMIGDAREDEYRASSYFGVHFDTAAPLHELTPLVGCAFQFGANDGHSTVPQKVDA